MIWEDLSEECIEVKRGLVRRTAGICSQTTFMTKQSNDKTTLRETIRVQDHLHASPFMSASGQIISVKDQLNDSLPFFFFLERPSFLTGDLCFSTCLLTEYDKAPCVETFSYDRLTLFQDFRCCQLIGLFFSVYEPLVLSCCTEHLHQTASRVSLDQNYQLFS